MKQQQEERHKADELARQLAEQQRRREAEAEAEAEMTADEVERARKAEAADKARKERGAAIADPNLAPRMPAKSQADIAANRAKAQAPIGSSKAVGR